MDVGEHLPQLPLETLVLTALVELADEVAVALEGVGGELQGGVAEVHGAGVVAEGDAARVHQPAVRVTQRVAHEAGGLGPGF